MIKLETTYYNEVTLIPDSVFEKLGCHRSFYFEKAFLDAFAKANSFIEHRYLVITIAQEAQALVALQQLKIGLENPPKNLSLQNKLAQRLQASLSNKQATVAFFGNLFLSGNYGVWVKEEANKKAIYKRVAQEMKPLRTQKKASVFFIKDFTDQEIPHTLGMKQHQFQSLRVEPNMRLGLSWPDFETYKIALRSKYRVKINKADSQSKSLIVKRFDARTIRAHKEQLQGLLCNVTDKAMFKTQDLSMETYALLKERFRESVFFTTYWHSNCIVGFATAFHVGDVLDAHYIGIDYSCNKELSIYPRMLNDYVRLGFELGCREVNLGRTSSEIKSTLGAQPQELTCYVRHRRTLANFIFKPLVRQLKMTAYNKHSPFKK